jgi:3-hydroxyisobutyrate dehydrogenase
MAARLVATGHTVAVYNRTASRAEPLVRAGATLARSPRAACDGADAVVAMLAHDEASRAMWLGADGALAAGLPRGTFAVECSTLSHAWALELADLAAQRGLRYIDAPVTGLPQAAAAGELTLLVGADDADLAAARPLLDAISNRIVHFGRVGTGTAYKLAVNLIGAVQIASAAEGLALAERAGLDPAVVVEAIATGQAASPQVVRNTRRMALGDFTQEVVFTPVLRVKDIEYALRLADEVGIGTPFGDVARAAFRRLIELGGGAGHESRVIEVARAEPAPNRRLQ